VPCAVIGGVLLAHAPLASLQKALGVFLVGVVIWCRLQRQPRKPTNPAFAATVKVFFDFGVRDAPTPPA
jgi:uncharacterized protein